MNHGYALQGKGGSVYIELERVPNSDPCPRSSYAMISRSVIQYSQALIGELSCVADCHWFGRNQFESFLTALEFRHCSSLLLSIGHTACMIDSCCLLRRCCLFCRRL